MSDNGDNTIRQARQAFARIEAERAAQNNPKDQQIRQEVRDAIAELNDPQRRAECCEWDVELDTTDPLTREEREKEAIVQRMRDFLAASDHTPILPPGKPYVVRSLEAEPNASNDEHTHGEACFDWSQGAHGKRVCGFPAYPNTCEQCEASGEAVSYCDECGESERHDHAFECSRFSGIRAVIHDRQQTPLFVVTTDLPKPSKQLVEFMGRVIRDMRRPECPPTHGETVTLTHACGHTRQVPSTPATPGRLAFLLQFNCMDCTTGTGKLRPEGFTQPTAPANPTPADWQRIEERACDTFPMQSAEPFDWHAVAERERQRAATQRNNRKSRRQRKQPAQQPTRNPNKAKRNR